MSQKENTMGKRAKRRDANLEFLETALKQNGRAMEEGGRKRKSWTGHDLKTIKPLTPPKKICSTPGSTV
jgi:hypothetical protein